MRILKKNLQKNLNLTKGAFLYAINFSTSSIN